MADIPPGYEELSISDVERLMDQLAIKKAEFKECDLCGTKDWKLFPTVISPNVLIRNVESKALKTWDAQSFNQVVFSCSNCGNSKFIELHFLGVAFSQPAGGGNG